MTRSIGRLGTAPSGEIAWSNVGYTLCFKTQSSIDVAELLATREDGQTLLEPAFALNLQHSCNAWCCRRLRIEADGGPEGTEGLKLATVHVLHFSIS